MLEKFLYYYYLREHLYCDEILEMLKKETDYDKKTWLRNAQKAIGTVATQYNVIDVLGSKKNEIYDLSTKTLSKMLKSEGVELVQLTIKDMNAGSEIEKAIADEAVAKKRVETAEQNRLKAQKDAETKIINAKAEAESNKILEKRLTNKLLVQQYLKKWDGKLPTVSGDGNTMIDISQLMK